MRSRRVVTAGAGALAVAVLLVAGCSSDSDDSSGSTTTLDRTGSTTSVIGGDVTAPVVLTASDPAATVKVGQVVTFDMGEPDGGTFVAVSDDPRVFEITGEGHDDGSATYNAGGKAVGVGVARVSVSFRGSVNGVGTPTVFTITVE